ncbi:hypothetical protein SNEBB_005198 [Seison nebaliae]|nr:hypothetical protein SNEBB_005198 [Seison nebaliae]
MVEQMIKSNDIPSSEPIPIRKKDGTTLNQKKNGKVKLSSDQQEELSKNSVKTGLSNTDYLRVKSNGTDRKYVEDDLSEEELSPPPSSLEEIYERMQHSYHSSSYMSFGRTAHSPKDSQRLGTSLNIHNFTTIDKSKWDSKERI